MTKNKLIAHILCVLTLIICCSQFIACTNNQPTIVPEHVAVEGISFTSAPIVSNIPGTNEGSKIITATVLPETATNKEVNWTIAWAEDNPNVVTNYVTVSPIENGSSIAIITCYQEFEGNVIITVSTRESGFSADCLVSFIGIPTSISLSTDAQFETDHYKLGMGYTYRFFPEAINPYGFVNDDYKTLDVSLTAFGSFVVGSYDYYVQSETDHWYEESLKTVTLASLMDEFIVLSYTDNTIHISTYKSIESYYENVSKIDGGRTCKYKNKFKEFVEECYFVLTITEPVSGISTSLTLKFDETLVTGISADCNQLFF